MCLYPKGNLKKAKHDIVCYKVMFRTQANKYFSIYWDRLDPWYEGKFKKAKYTRPLRYNSYVILGFGEIGDGFFHSYVNEIISCDDEMCVCKCIIPKKTYYFEGIHSDGNYGYASKKLKIVKVIKPDKHDLRGKVKYIAK